MTDVEGKISVWIRGGSFSHASDLYIQVLVDDEKVSVHYPRFPAVP